MTMQVGMVGTNGIVLASDRYWMNTPVLRRGELWSGARYGNGRTKIKVNHERGMVVACAWDMDTAGLIAESIISDWKDEDSIDPEAALEQLCESVPDTDKRRAQCLVVITRPTPQMFWLQTVSNADSDWSPWCRKTDTIAITGDTTNAAIFWAERYYRKFRLLSLPMERLIPLASHLIGSAKTLNTAGIDGLEILLCNSGGIHPLSGESIEVLERQAERWDDTIGNLFLNHQQQYTYELC